MSISVTTAEKAQLKAKQFVLSPLAGSTGSERALYHNPKTGQELTLPGDPDDIAWYMRKGFRLGPAPAGLVYTPDPDPMDEPQYRKDLPKGTDGTTDYIQQLEQRIAALEGNGTAKPAPKEEAVVEEQLPLF